MGLGHGHFEFYEQFGFRHVERYAGNYSAYRKQRDENLLAQARAYKSQQQTIQKEMEYIRRHMGSRMTAQAKGRV